MTNIHGMPVNRIAAEHGRNYRNQCDKHQEVGQNPFEMGVDVQLQPMFEEPHVTDRGEADGGKDSSKEACQDSNLGPQAWFVVTHNKNDMGWSGWEEFRNPAHNDETNYFFALGFSSVTL